MLRIVESQSSTFCTTKLLFSLFLFFSLRNENIERTILKVTNVTCTDWSILQFVISGWMWIMKVWVVLFWIYTSRHHFMTASGPSSQQDSSSLSQIFKNDSLITASRYLDDQIFKNESFKVTWLPNVQEWQLQAW